MKVLIASDLHGAAHATSLLVSRIEEEKPTAFGKMKHWHIFNIIARKK